MAEITLTKRWFTDPRRDRLASLVGSERSAHGLMVQVWLSTWHYWKEGLLYPGRVFQCFPDWMCIIQAGLATVHTEPEYMHSPDDEGVMLSQEITDTSKILNEIEHLHVYVKGSDEHLCRQNDGIMTADGRGGKKL